MGLLNIAAQYRAYKEGVMHTTLNPQGPGAVRIHLIPPRFRLLGRRSFVVVLNGHYILPIGYSWAILLKNFIGEIEKYDGRPMTKQDMDAVVLTAVNKTHRTYPETGYGRLALDLGALLEVLFDVACGREPRGEIGVMSLRQYAPNMTAPHRMDLLISPMTDGQGNWNCNLKCLNCYAAGQPQAGTPALSTQEWIEIINKCRTAGIPQLTFTGGEPTLREDLPVLINSARWFVTRLNTNGVLLTPSLCNELRRASLDSVQITVYSHDAAVHNKLVGADLPGATGNWEKTVTGLRNALRSGLDVSVNTPLCAANRDYIKTLTFLLAEGVRYVSCSGLIETGKAEKTLSSRLSRADITEILKDAAAYCGQTGMELSFTSPGQVDAQKLAAMGLTVPMCGAGLSNMAVAPNGDVMPCQSWLGTGQVLGNLLSDPWKSIWEHPRCAEIRAMDEEQALLCPLRQQDETGGCC